ncbi:putative DNA repair protein [Polaribacter irgensii 23-P]|uniref:Putative DNA repair protein n=1 Tax=Polaribacter irgensii 23-P TaxID=313594 RepID=A4C291_9FLAO|nr:DNA repair protein RadC [Polaribacter irgensii]EAR11692.1 putative DNA repair protein [Polaribacter irgensii 23-P]
MEKLTIKSWALDDRPREKLVAKGRNALSDAELIAILIGSGNREETAVALSKRILKTVNGNLNALAKLSVEKLTAFKGIGLAKAISIITALELGKRKQLEIALERPKITGSADVANTMQSIIGHLEHEEFWVIYLNNSNKVVAKGQISKGGLTATLVDVRLVFKRALELASVGIIVCHNHPSGKLQPSAADKQLTLKIKEAGITLDIKLLDHLIITEKAYFSFADEGLL